MSGGRENICRRVVARITEERFSFCRRSRERRQQFLEQQHAADRSEKLETLRKAFEQEGGGTPSPSAVDITAYHGKQPTKGEGGSLSSHHCSSMSVESSSGNAGNDQDDEGDHDFEVLDDIKDKSVKPSVGFYSKQLVICDWIVKGNIPNDLGLDWMSYLRPQGKRCLVVSARGRVTVRDKCGSVMGDVSTSEKSLISKFLRNGLTVFDCVMATAEKKGGGGHQQQHQGFGETATTMCCLDDGAEVVGEGVDDYYYKEEESYPGDVAMATSHEEIGCSTKKKKNNRRRRSGNRDVCSGGGGGNVISSSLFWICDVLWWNGISLCDSSMECRLFFLKSRFEECKDEAAARGDGGEADLFCPFRLVDCQRCTTDFVHRIYHGHAPFRTESLVFVHKEALYLPGFNPLWLCWKDQHLSQFCIDTVIPKHRGRRREDNNNNNSGDVVVARDEQTACGGEFPQGVEDADKVADRQLACLEVSDNGALITADEVNVGYIDVDEMENRNIQIGDVIRVDFASINFSTVLPKDEIMSSQISTPLPEFLLEDIRALNVKTHHRSKLRRPPEPLNRIIFQHKHRMLLLSRNSNSTTTTDASTTAITTTTVGDGIVSFETLLTSIAT
eukprot:GHVS01023413.1.p1 GENE.GHVS01023413.1~~GHVS01023413.1.p1  ORF type:complete len:616 (+),score=148.01 GHVS01023413.1:160-2007(+)